MLFFSLPTLMLILYNRLIVDVIIPKHKRFVNMAVAYFGFIGVILVRFCRNGVGKMVTRRFLACSDTR